MFSFRDFRKRELSKTPDRIRQTASRRRRLMLESLESRRPLAVNAVMGLAPPDIDGQLARFEITIEFAADQGESLTYFSLDLGASSDQLGGSTADFSRFSFDTAAPLLDDWRQIGFFNDPGFESSVEFDDGLVAPIAPGSYTLGTLTVDLDAAAGILGGDIEVSIAGPRTFIGVEDSGGTFRFEPVSFDPPSQTVVSLDLSGADTTVEGDLYTLTIDTEIATDGTVEIQWGDGASETFNVSALMVSNSVTHVFADGNADPVIVATLRLADGTLAASTQFPIHVSNVPPQVMIVGDSQVEAGATYTLALSEIVDPGNDTVTEYQINWGDGTQDVIPASQFPANRQVTHVFTEGDVQRSVVVDLVDEDGRHPASATTTVFVQAPLAVQVQITGPESIVEGIPYPLLIGPITGTGSDLVSTLVIHWGDQSTVSIAVTDLPTDRTLNHLYTNGPANVVIAVDLLDAAGVSLATATLPVQILAIPITIDQWTNTASDPGLIAPGESVTATGIVLQPDLLNNPNALIDWGDGTDPEPVAIEITNGVGIVHATHVYDDAGVYTVELTIGQQDADTVSIESIAYITGAVLQQNRLLLLGSSGNDIITVTPSGTDQIFVNMTLPGTGNIRQSFRLADVSGIDVYVGSGNDRVMVSERLTIETLIDGGEDDDLLQGGSGANIVFGGPGDDQILGGAANDILVAGAGSNLILGYEGDDVLVGASWLSSPSQRSAIFAVWNSSDDFEIRRQRILDDLDLVPDLQIDKLYGGNGRNLYIASVNDRISENGDDVFGLDQAIDFGSVFPDTPSIGLSTFEPTPSQSTAIHQSPAPAPPIPMDTNEDGNFSALDALVVINAITQLESQENELTPGHGQLIDRLDVSRDGRISAIDALVIINELGRQSSLGSAEREFAMHAKDLEKMLGAVQWMLEPDNDSPLDWADDLSSSDLMGGRIF